MQLDINERATRIRGQVEPGAKIAAVATVEYFPFRKQSQVSITLQGDDPTQDLIILEMLRNFCEKKIGELTERL